MLTPEYFDEIPEMTAEVANAIFPKGNNLMKLRDELGVVFEDKEFVRLYPNNGQPAVSPSCLAMATVLQFMENLTDRETANAVKTRIDWKYVLGLELTDQGFHYSVLSEFRDRLREQEAGCNILDKILTHCQEKKLLKQNKQRTDATHILANIRTLNRVEIVGETMRQVLNEVAKVAPEWLLLHIQPEWGKRYGRNKFDLSRTRKSKTQKLAMAQVIGEDGRHLLGAMTEKDAPTELARLNSVLIMRQIWTQQYYMEEEQMHWRTKEQYGTPPSRKMVASPYELDARYASKNTLSWIGYKVHVTETCDDDSPRLITQVETTAATTPDHQLTEKIQADLISRNLQPTQHWVDGGYTDVNILLNSQENTIDLVGPLRRNNSWQAKTEGGYDQYKFEVNWERMVATCPEGEESIHWKHWKATNGSPNFQFVFPLSTCQGCPAREKCTRAKKIGRSLTVPPQKAYEALRTARHRQSTDVFEELYHRRAGVEGTMGQVANAKGARRSRYRGLGKTHLQHLLMATAINLERVANWLLGERPGTTRVSHFTALALPL